MIVCTIAWLVAGVYFWVYRSSRRYGTITVAPALHSAPELSMTDLNGGAVQTSNYKGKVVLVNFWAAWCTPCAEEIPQFIALEKKYQDQGLQVIGISVEDDPRELRDFYRKYRMNYPVVPSDLKIADAFGGVLGLPTTFVIGRDNLIHGKHSGATDFSVIEKEVVALLRAPQG
jgi:thiol-disulfide isomerase/thioredoxin